MLNEDCSKERRIGKFSSLDSSFLRDKLLKRLNAKTKKTFKDESNEKVNEKPVNIPNGSTDEIVGYKEKMLSATTIFSFSRVDQSAEREQKTQLLLDLLEMLDSQSSLLMLSDELLPIAFQMIKANIFRPFHFIPKPSSSVSTMNEADDEETLLESSWPHIQLVYQYFLRLIILPQFTAPLSLQYLDRTFIEQVISLKINFLVYLAIQI